MCVCVCVFVWCVCVFVCVFVCVLWSSLLLQHDRLRVVRSVEGLLELSWHMPCVCGGREGGKEGRGREGGRGE